MLWLFVFVSPWLFAHARPPTMTIDQVIESSMVGNYALDLLEQNDTVLVELDILYTKTQWEQIQRQRQGESGNPSSRKAISYTTHRWTNKVVPYTIDYSFSSQDRGVLHQAMDDYHRWTCVTFRPRAHEENYLSIVNGGGCSSYVGMIGGAQPVTLAYNCRYRATVVHEFGHAIGFQHEQCRPDRDNHVIVYTQNVWPGMEYNFDKFDLDQANSYGIPYDYMSVMQYGETAFSANGQVTMVARDPAYQKLMGTAPTLSFPDLKLANHIYQCASHCGSKTCPGDGYLDKNCKCMCAGSPVRECGGGDDGGEDTCEDLHTRCAEWASQGECEANAVCMGANCRKSCGTCSGGGGGDDCEDSHANCADWASQGECEANPEWMGDNCQKSCGTCSSGGGGGVCEDSHEHCADWASQGECEANAEWMGDNCQKSCGTCEEDDGNDGDNKEEGGNGGTDEGNGDSGDDDEDLDDEECVDEHESCPSWAEAGYCEDNPFTQDHCRKSCGACGCC